MHRGIQGRGETVEPPVTVHIITQKAIL